MENNKIEATPEENGKTKFQDAGASLFSIASIVENLSKIATHFIKIFFAFGCLIAVLYLFRIGYFPQGLSLGDGLLFFMVAVCFGGIYSVFLGIIFSPALTALTIKQSKKADNFYWLKFLACIIANILILSFFVALLCGEDFSGFIGLLWATIFSSFILYFACTAISKTKPGDMKIIQGKSVALITVLMLMVALAPLQIIDSKMRDRLFEMTMSAAQIRVKEPVLHIMGPYREILSGFLKTASTQSEFTTYRYKDNQDKKLTVTFHGFGDETVLSFEHDNYRHQIAIPNSHIIVERKMPLSQKAASTNGRAVASNPAE